MNEELKSEKLNVKSENGGLNFFVFLPFNFSLLTDYSLLLIHNLLVDRTIEPEITLTLQQWKRNGQKRKSTFSS